MKIESLNCPITLQPMTEPVLAPDGHTYERNAIEGWLRQNGTSPQTRQPMRIEDLVPNRIVRAIIDQQNQDESVLQVLERIESESSDNEGLSEDIYDNFDFSNLGDFAKTNTKLTTWKSTYSNDQSIVHIATPSNINYNSSEVSNSDTTSTRLPPNHICCVIDISGSMDDRAVTKDENGLENSTGLTILDVVKFATLVISKSLTDCDLLSIVTFSDQAQKVLSPTRMNQRGKDLVESTLESIKTCGCTNLWAGIKESISVTTELGSKYNSSIFVLTDGLPNIHPPLGYERSIKRLMQNSPIFGSLSTFGFGYSLDSILLRDIATMGNGNFSFIPDAGFVGTCFINAIANARCAFGFNTTLKITCNVGNMNKNQLTADGYLQVTEDDDNYVSISLNPIRVGASIDVVLNINNIEDYSVSLEFKVVGGDSVTLSALHVESVNECLDIFHHTRVNFVKNAYLVSSNSYNDSIHNIFDTDEEVKDYRTRDRSIDALCKDMEGQAKEAVSNPSWFNRWGTHYLLSLAGAHLHQFCNNFKDPGVQVYGKGTLFGDIQESLNDIFETIPPPKPSRPIPSSSARMYSMAQYYNNSNMVCVHPKSRVSIKVMNAGDEVVISIPISQVRKGDHILTENGLYVKVDCLIQTIIDGTKPLILVKLGSLEVTPYHPIKYDADKGWEFPINIKAGKLIQSDANSVYNLVLEEGQRHKAVLIDNIPTITLGHGIVDDPLLNHEFFATEKIVSDLSKIKEGWMSGHIILNETDIKRDSSGKICGITLSKVHADNGHNALGSESSQIANKNDVVCLA
jgi:hypothetical protein